MLTHPTLEQMQALGLTGMAAAYRQLAEQDNAADLSRDEWLGLMLDRETAMRADRRLTNRLAAAKLRFADACIEDIDFGARRGLDRRNILQLAQGAWLKAKGTSSSPDRPALAKHGSPAPSHAKPPGLIIPCSIYGCRDCSKTSPWPASTAASRVWSTSSLASNC